MEYKVGDLVKLEKRHPCGCDIWGIIRIGMDIKIRCNKCHRIIIIGRAQFKNLLVSVEAKEQVKLKPSIYHNILKDGKNWIRNIQNPSIDDMKQSVKENAMTIRFINNPPDEVIKIAIEQNPMCIQFLNISDISLQKYAVDKTVATLQNIQNPSDEIISYAIKKNPKLMRKYAKKPSGNIIKLNNTKMTVELIKNIFTDSAEIKEKIVKQDGRFIGYINDCCGILNL